MITICTYIRTQLTTLILSADGSQQLKIYALETVTSSYRKEMKHYLDFLVVAGGKMIF
jgi:hypothetical protein